MGMPKEVPEVLFVCVHNAGRSQMAAALLDHHSQGRVHVTMGCGDACPVYPGKRYLDWELDDPAGKPADEVRPIRDEIDRRVRALIEDLVPATR
jgi:arsenate reductase